jgi:predicted dehydrogenase/threonine dehydrogenase-like Zn-dependent dehydrogenase
MKQLTQKLLDGKLAVLDVPPPLLAPGMVLVRNCFSLISAGTEGSKVSAGRKNLVEKAKARPQQARQAMEMLLQQGPLQTYRTVMKKLDAYSPLGYSSAGEVIAVAPGVTGFRVGDQVACGGGQAAHAEVLAVPANLCVLLPPGSNMRIAAFNTLGAIALQGIRQADLRLGENCAIIGMGLLGQLTGLMLTASGIRVVGIDIDPFAVGKAIEGGAELSLRRNDPGLMQRILEMTHGQGVDAVIISAGASTTDPINLAGALCRKKGRVVVVGNVPTGFDRDPHYYPKELDVRMSCSYGPGRYDPSYEDKGIDYPFGYVRWTENRNMAEFQQLLHSRRISIDHLLTHEFPLEEAPEAYRLILERTVPYMGILLRYEHVKDTPDARILVSPPRPAVSPVQIAFIGAGSYAQGNLLPNLPRSEWIARRGVMTSSGVTSRRVAERFGFNFATSDAGEILGDQNINTVFIVTRHDSHAHYATLGLQAGKNVFVEKPLALTRPQLKQVKESYLGRETPPLLMVGFNRRFAPLSRFLKDQIGEGPMAMVYRVNAGPIPRDSWIQDPEVGGGRIIGEACHFVDYLTFLCGSIPVKVFGSLLPDPQGTRDTATITLEFANGSVGTVAYFSNGPRILPKEQVEVFRAGSGYVLNNFQEAITYTSKDRRKKRLLMGDKGQKGMIDAFLRAVREGEPSPIDADEIFAVSEAVIAAVESFSSGQPVTLDR